MKSLFYLFVAILGLNGQAFAKGELNVYSFRKPEIISPLIKSFEESTGVKTNLVYGKPQALLKKLASERQKNRADIILTSELSQLNSKLNLLQPIELDNDTYSRDLVDDKKLWVALSLRVRALFTLKESNSKPILYFSQLNDPRFQGTFCNRDFSHSYNQQLKSALLAISGSEEIKWLEQPISLLQKRPSGGDRDQLRALYKKQCQYAFSNHYYYYMLKKSDSPFDKEVAAHLNMHILKTDDGLTPVSATAAAISRYAPNTKNAQRFVNFLLSKKAQKLIATQLNEFAVNKEVRTQQISNNRHIKLALHSIKGAL